MKDSPRNNKRLVGIVFLGLAALFLPIIVILVRDTTNLTSRAALPNQLETETGVLSSTGVSKQSNSDASGGQYIEFNKQSNPTPTSSPNPSIPPDSVYVPDSIDPTGNTDVQKELNDFIKSAPDGSTIVFKKDGTYQLSRMIWMRGRNDITLEGNGAKLKLTGNDSNGYWDAAMYIDYFSENIIIRNFNVLGNFALAGTPDACCPREGQAGFRIAASKNILIENVNITKVGGDCFTLTSSWEETAPNNGITIKNSTCTLTGRLIAHVINSRNVVLEGITADKIGSSAFGSEANNSFEDVYNLIIRNNNIGTYGLMDSYEGVFYYYSDAWWNDGATDMSGITISGNTIEGNISGRKGLMLGLDIYIYDNEAGIRENVKVTNNIAKKAVDASRKRFGSAMRFENVKGVTVTGNIQPLTSGALTSYFNCTNIIENSNNTN